MAVKFTFGSTYLVWTWPTETDRNPLLNHILYYMHVPYFDTIIVHESEIDNFFLLNQNEIVRVAGLNVYRWCVIEKIKCEWNAYIFYEIRWIVVLIIEVHAK